MIKVLNHGHVRLVESMGSDLSVVRNARVSYDAEWRSGDDAGKDAKLINYLVKNGHTSPLEAVQFTFDIKAPIFVLRQWHRHRTWSYNEVSARYTELPEEFYVPDVEQITTQSASNKQMRTDKVHPRADDHREMIKAVCLDAFGAYQDMLADGVPRELARGVLPMNTYSHMFATVDLMNLTKFFKLRLHEHAQYEIRVYAEAMLALVEPLVPVTVAAIREHWL
jgi:thymidylate synthase (FAD)